MVPGEPDKAGDSSPHFYPRVALSRRMQRGRDVIGVVLERQCVSGGYGYIVAYATAAVQNSDLHGLTPTAKCWRGCAAL